MRLDVIDREEMTERQRELADRIIAKRGKIGGPFKVWLHSPELCDRVEALGAFVRFDCSLPERVREYALLVAARLFDAQFSWNSHVEQAIERGVPAGAVRALANHEQPDFGGDAELQVFHDFAVELLTTHFVSDETYARLTAVFTDQQLVDAVGLLGNFTLLSMCLNTFQVDLQPGVEPPFPDVRGYAKV
ncbi:carboxymuconolactone decarboxylase family protein [Microbacterium fluvii]|uniref:Carboxymuconolactone decarboxylase family protein n=1 Tax=Microbacterium fluvii TaxID=415215 RepID=A0ABW2HH20_9MICO|nr:carboxymuconolactone decarboxylase family protein [Microbacterium fluvii]MCU4673850.1 carboxymuconolactone decarboxylase family protein [Microbacterium fluvii]